MIQRVTLCLLALSTVSCATHYEPDEVNALIVEAVDRAASLIDAGRPVEAAQLVTHARRVDAEHADLLALEGRIAQSDRAVGDLFAPTRLGANVPRRLEVARPVAIRALLYLPDRLVDLLDVITMEAHVGVGAYADLHLTRGAQAAAGARGVVGLGTYGARTIVGSRAQANAGVTVLPAGASAQSGALVSAAGIRTGVQTLAGLHRPTDAYYQTFEDYWALGTSLTIGCIGLTAEIHPLQLADFVLGLALIDVLRDDYAHTAALRLTRSDERLIRALTEVAASAEVMQGYSDARDADDSYTEPTVELD